MEQTTLTTTRCFVRELADGQEVNDFFLVRTHSRRQKRNGDEFLKLQLGDKSGIVEAVIWDGVDELAPVCPAGSVVRILGRYSVDERYGAAITVRRMRAAEDHEFDLDELTEAPPVSYEEMTAALDTVLETIRRPHLRTLLARLIDPSTPTGAAYHAAPAAKHYHQAYRHGLLEHCLSVAQGVNALASGPFAGGVDRELAVTGALLHDIGKTEVYAIVNGAIELTDRGKLLGEIPIGYYIVRREAERIEGFPPADAEALLHIILSHHGKLEHGSPVIPCTREATLVHFVDNLGGNLGSFDRIERTLADGASWSDFDRGISASAFFGPREQARREEAA
jgi:3'-5' exoribonuclease